MNLNRTEFPRIKTRLRAPLILASASPRRLEILQAEGISVIAVEHRYSEPLLDMSNDGLIGHIRDAVDCAERKALSLPLESLAVDYPGRFALAADTIVVSPACRAFGKPSSADDARRMLNALSGQIHHVITGVCGIDPSSASLHSTFAISAVEFICISDSALEEYIESGAWADKAGGYGIQDAASAFVAGLNGSLDNVIGLPMDSVYEVLRRFDGA
ncbi:MAG: Maf family protein [Planctomycetota bacterium]